MACVWNKLHPVKTHKWVVPGTPTPWVLSILKFPIVTSDSLSFCPLKKMSGTNCQKRVMQVLKLDNLFCTREAWSPWLLTELPLCAANNFPTAASCSVIRRWGSTGKRGTILRVIERSTDFHGASALSHLEQVFLWLRCWLRNVQLLNGSHLGRTGLGICSLGHQSKWFGDKGCLEIRKKFLFGNLSP